MCLDIAAAAVVLLSPQKLKVITLSQNKRSPMYLHVTLRSRFTAK